MYRLFRFPAAARRSRVRWPDGPEPDGRQHDGEAGGSDVHAAAAATSHEAAGQPHAATDAVSTGQWIDSLATCVFVVLMTKLRKRICTVCMWVDAQAL